MMPSQSVDCPEVVGKTVQSLKLYSTDKGDAEIVIEFTDGASFSSSFESRSALKGSLIRTGIGTPEVLKDYTAWVLLFLDGLKLWSPTPGVPSEVIEGVEFTSEWWR
jgi:hypothetical protein